MRISTFNIGLELGYMAFDGGFDSDSAGESMSQAMALRRSFSWVAPFKFLQLKVRRYGAVSFLAFLGKNSSDKNIFFIEFTELFLSDYGSS